MDFMNQLLGWIGIYGVTALGVLGSIVGCSRAGQAACGAMLEVESGYGRMIGISAMPSSQTIYSIVIMLSLNREVNAANAAPLFAIGILCGLTLMISAMYQGSCCAVAISTAKYKPDLFGMAIAPAALVEGFAVFSFVMALLLIGSIPEG